MTDHPLDLLNCVDRFNGIPGHVETVQNSLHFSFLIVELNFFFSDVNLGIINVSFGDKKNFKWNKIDN